MATTIGHEKGHPPRHRYPTRWSLRRHASLSLSMTPNLEDRDKNQVLVACKRKKEENNSLSLPREIIFNILLLNPAPVLYEVVRYVCKRWYDVVSDPLFVKAHKQMSSAGFLIQDVFKFQACYVEAGTTTGLKLTQLDIPIPAKIMGSQSGLLLLHDLRNHLIFHVMNLVTKEKITLPPLVELGKNYTGTCFALTSAGHYKVFHATGCTRSDKIYMRVFTVGIDKAWRFIDLQGIPMKTSKNYTMLYRPLYVAGFSYWYHTGLCSGFALDADSETIYRFPKPNYEWPCYIRTVFLTIGTCLGFIELGTWKLWKLTDFKSGKWSELVGVGLNLKEARDRIAKVFYPSRSMVFNPINLIKEEFWFLHGGQELVNVVRYNLTTGRFVFYPLPTKHPNPILHSHNSYVKKTKGQSVRHFSPAVAIMVGGDKVSFYDCSFIGYQDTLWDDRGRHYFKNCYIEGAVDFIWPIWGSAQSFYEGCSINVIDGGFVTAQGMFDKRDRRLNN